MAANPIDRIKDKLARAAQSGAKVAAKIEAKADALIARAEHMEAKTDQSFAPHEEIMDAANQQLDHLDSALGQLSNGGPQLTDEPEVTPVPGVRGYPH